MLVFKIVFCNTKDKLFFSKFMQCAKMEAELQTYKNALPMTAACQALVQFNDMYTFFMTYSIFLFYFSLIQSITQHPEPFISRSDPNPWVASSVSISMYWLNVLIMFLTKTHFVIFLGRWRRLQYFVVNVVRL